MTVREFADNAELKVLCIPSPDRTVSGAYIGDLLSWVMGRATADCAWITIMSNVNVVAVASLVDVSCIVLCEGVTLTDDVLNTAMAKDINVFTTDLTAYELSQRIGSFI